MTKTISPVSTRTVLASVVSARSAMKQRVSFIRTLAAVLSLLAVTHALRATESHAGMITIDAKSNIFAAGRTNTSTSGGGLLPPVFNLQAGTGRVLTFSSVTGLTEASTNNPPFIPPDGTTNLTTNINTLDGISGILSPTIMFLVGVFLDGTSPSGDVAPPRLDFSTPPTGLGVDFVALSPLLNQTFFVGDGLGAGGTTQVFQVPDAANRLFFGFADASFFTGSPGLYDDNVGSLTAEFNVVPEPSTFTLAGFGLIALLACRWRRRRPT